MDVNLLPEDHDASPFLTEASSHQTKTPIPAFLTTHQEKCIILVIFSALLPVINNPELVDCSTGRAWM